MFFSFQDLASSPFNCPYYFCITSFFDRILLRNSKPEFGQPSVTWELLTGAKGEVWDTGAHQAQEENLTR